MPTTGELELPLAGVHVRAQRLARFGIVLRGIVGADPGQDWLHALLRTPDDREAMFELVDREGLVVCLDVHTTHPSYRDVRGRSSRGRLSQGEYYHHDGCSSPTRPRVVEIRCPHQPTERHTRTAIAPFPDTVIAMLHALPESLRERSELADWRTRIAGASLGADDWDLAQAAITRLVRRELSTPLARAYFDAVDVDVGAYREPWAQGECRLIANENPHRTMQHRRAYLEPPQGRPNGRLVKRWPAEELALGPAMDTCARDACARADHE